MGYVEVRGHADSSGVQEALQPWPSLACGRMRQAENPAPSASLHLATTSCMPLLRGPPLIWPSLSASLHRTWMPGRLCTPLQAVSTTECGLDGHTACSGKSKQASPLWALSTSGCCHYCLKQNPNLLVFLSNPLRGALLGNLEQNTTSD